MKLKNSSWDSKCTLEWALSSADLFSTHPHILKSILILSPTYFN
jgi:hypothetical protein